MTFPAYTRRTIVFRASGETLVLIAAVTAMTFALASVAHKRPQQVETSSVAQQQDWTGHLAGLPSNQTVAKTDSAMTSASLVVPTSALALPADSAATTPTRAAAPGTAAKPPRSCDGATCAVTAKSAGIPVSPSRDKAPATGVAPIKSDVVQVKSDSAATTSLMAKLNPLNHIPDAVSRPFGYAGDKLSGWFNRL